ncbi:MAG: hypothetical protein JSW25_07780 [Thermoplasmata archaeon]|nr:MAG: hypothetical protein JSW25_07780 [Thermoplasmata archaeon]
MKPRYVAVLLGVLFVMSALAPASQAAPEDEEIPMLRLFFEKETYTIGEQVNITAEVTANGRYVNPDLGGVALAILMNFTFGQGGPGDIQWIGMNSVPGERGIFTGSFLSEPHHLVALEPQSEGLPLMGKAIFMMALCQYKQVGANAMGLIMIEDGPVINVMVSDHYPSPGDTVTVTVTTTNGTVVDAADVIVGLSSYDGEIAQDLADLTVTRESTGVYKASYTVPVDLRYATLYTVNAGASFADYNASAYLQPLFGTGFMVSFYDVWFQNVSATDDQTELAVWVAGLDGTALEGIDVSLDLEIYLKGGGTDMQSLSGTTEADGKAEFSISHAAAERVDMKGMVDDGTLFQRFYMEGMIDTRPPQEPSPDDAEDNFDVIPWETSDSGPIFDMIKEPGDPIDVKYRVFNDTGAVPDKRINWYLVDRDGFFDTNWTVLDSGFKVTDANGDFDLTFQVPPNDVNGWLMFEAVMWNSDDMREERMETSEPLIDAGFFARDENIKITVDRVHKDNPVELRATVPLPESYYIGQFFAVYDEETGLTNWGQPQALGPMSDDFNIMPLPKMGPDLFGMDKQLPEFFPEDQGIAFMVLSVDLMAFKIQMNYIMMGYGESTTKGMDVSQPVEPEPIHVGTNGTLEFNVDNTGAGTDHYTIEQMTGADWLVWDNETLTVEPSETGTFMATVVVPEGIDENRYYFNVTVRSETDDNLSRDMELWVDVLVNGVEVSIEDDEMTAFPEETVEFVVSIENTGQGNDTFTIALDGDAAGWATPSHTSVTLQEGGTAEVIVSVMVPDVANEEAYDLTLTATSEDGVTSDSVGMSVNVLVDGVTIEADTDLAETWREVILPLVFVVTNTGQGDDTFTITLEDGVEDWAVLSDTSIEVAEGASETVLLEVTPAADAAAGFYEFTLMATSANGVTNDSASSTVHVWVTGVALTPDEDSKVGYREDQLVFDIEMENTGQERDVFALTFADADWAESVIFSSTPVALDPDEVGTLGVTVILPDDIDEGTYTLSVTATSQDTVTTETVELEVKVTVNGVEIALSQESIIITKGKEKEVTLTVTNTGQGSDTFSILMLGEASNWTEADMSVITLEEGASGTVTLTLSPGKDVKGKQAFLDITVVSSDPEFNAATQLEVVLRAPPEDGGISSSMLIAIVVIALIIVALLVYMMQAKND